jgi:hypothetical protein
MYSYFYDYFIIFINLYQFIFSFSFIIYFILIILLFFNNLLISISLYAQVHAKLNVIYHKNLYDYRLIIY